ncbi:phosphatase PAP2 family protein [Aspergillus affinis]|uniref:phosphatase PAP2 family protein n=1 Tax=Aspergillus affinis TaxID=1070780 RepID=UPI0022FDBCE9|nr:uncharacterized protein KD926_006433 [Aspergillus affinis]KAI9041887.1 hypothetical protein KD926_006433 [Aspergillus affinis]
MATSASQSQQPDLGKPQFASHSWLEPVIVVSIMIGSLIMNRRRNYSVLRSRKTSGLNDPYSDDEGYAENGSCGKTQTVCGITIDTPDSSRWAHHVHSRLLQKFPFLVEMFYWAVNYLFYSVTKATSQWLSPAQIGVVQVAQNHGVSILEFEHKSFFSFFFSIEEADFQHYFVEYHPGFMTFFNRIYSLVHIPGTVLFLSWYYYAAEDHKTFAVARRTMTLGNLAAFIIFCVYPCMPPRLLPESYRFFDTVRQDHAESVWVGGKSINQFAAMPSLHFTYAFVIGCTFLYHSGILQRFYGRPTRRAAWKQIMYITLAIVYPLLVLSVIVATANHYWLDAVVAIFTVSLCYLGNRVLCLLLPIEYCICWALRLAKPIPTTGDRSLAKYYGRRDDIQYNPV